MTLNLILFCCKVVILLLELLCSNLIWVESVIWDVNGVLLCGKRTVKILQQIENIENLENLCLLHWAPRSRIPMFFGVAPVPVPAPVSGHTDHQPNLRNNTNILQVSWCFRVLHPHKQCMHLKIKKNKRQSVKHANNLIYEKSINILRVV